MYSMMIVDDEPKIRRGLSNLLWQEIGVEVIGEAKDGVEALKRAGELSPDLMLVDINMPNVGGLELIKTLKENQPGCLIIIISGYDEFEYAKEALKLKVFDYLLKPVRRGELFEVVKRAIKMIKTDSKSENYVKWAKNQVISDKETMRAKFFQKWVAGGLNDHEINQNLLVFELDVSVYETIMLINILSISGYSDMKISGELLVFCVKNICEELIEPYGKATITKIEKDMLVILADHINKDEQVKLEKEMISRVEKYLHYQINVKSETGDITYKNFLEHYFKLSNSIREQGAILPIVTVAKNYILTNYSDKNLTLSDVAKQIKVSDSYLSKLFKQELGVTFTELLISIRIDKAIQLMENPVLKIYEISDRVGYSTQHYFSAAFKKINKVSPVRYRKERF